MGVIGSQWDHQGQSLKSFSTGTDSVASPVGQMLASTMNNFGSVATAWPAANTAIFMPIIVQRPVTFTQIAFFVQTSSGNYDVGIYDDSMSRIVSSGSTALAGSAVILVNNITDTPVVPGYYWMAMALSSTTARVRVATPAIGMSRATGVLSQASALPLPATATPVAIPAASASAIPLLAAHTTGTTV